VGAVHREATIAGLAAGPGLDPAALAATVARFGEFAGTGRDEDFHRGDSAYDRYYRDPRRRPNPCLAPLDTPPFYAVKIVPGDLGTKGGLRTDARPGCCAPTAHRSPGCMRPATPAPR
jgi:3-oxosteroid 1-dehydrogenase